MARITVEDCLQYVDNRFELVLLATKRARQLSFGTVEPLVPWEHDKPTVVALREIATGQISEEFIKACAASAQEYTVKTQSATYNYPEQSLDYSEDLSAVSFKDDDLK